MEYGRRIGTREAEPLVPDAASLNHFSHRRLGAERSNSNDGEGVPSFEILSTDDRDP